MRSRSRELHIHMHICLKLCSSPHHRHTTFLCIYAPIESPSLRFEENRKLLLLLPIFFLSVFLLFFSLHTSCISEGELSRLSSPLLVILSYLKLSRPIKTLDTHNRSKLCPDFIIPYDQHVSLALPRNSKLHNLS